MLSRAWLLSVPLIAAIPLVACSGSDSSSAPAGVDSGGGGGDSSLLPDTSSTPDSAPPLDGGGNLDTVSFHYTPAWSGVTAVSVIGGFGQANDWMPGQPLVTLAPDGNGGFSGSAQLPNGSYPYVFQVTGDAAAAVPATFQRFVVDPANPAFVPCPMASPTFDKNAPNPCSSLSAPQPSAAPLYHLRGTVTYDGAPKAGYIVLLERQENGGHHFPANRTDSAQDGTFDFPLAAGRYRIQVQHPTLLAENDAQRDPLTLLAMRRSISTPMMIAGPTAFDPVDVAYHDYDKLAPADGGAALPTTFAYTIIAGSLSARVAVYGPGSNVGDPWYANPFGAATSDVFDGGFNTMQATAPAVVTGTMYWWGTWQTSGSADGGVRWSGQSMVFPVTFH